MLSFSLSFSFFPAFAFHPPLSQYPLLKLLRKKAENLLTSHTQGCLAASHQVQTAWESTALPALSTVNVCVDPVCAYISSPVVVYSRRVRVCIQ